jgi:hypothetical protein
MFNAHGFVSTVAHSLGSFPFPALSPCRSISMRVRL